MSDDNDEPMPVVIEGDKNVRNEIVQWLRSGKIDFNYKITTNFFTGKKGNHSDVIDLWREDYETPENKNKFKIMKITKKNNLKNQHVSGIKGTDKSDKRIEVFLLCFDTSDDEINYGCISGNVSITSNDKDMIEKIRGHPEELAVNNFVSDPEVYEAIIENWIEEYGKNIKDSLEKDNYFFEIRTSDNIKIFILLFVQKNEKEYRYISIDFKINKDILDDYFFILLENN
ncbi:11120_t:CDS:2, partial [Scutellospora calospora]